MNDSEGIEKMTGEKLLEHLLEAERRVGDGVDEIPVYEEELIIFGKTSTQ
jgi:hypothetical protein